MATKQIDIGEETGPRTVVSGLVNYIPIEEMRDKFLVAVVRKLSRVILFTLLYLTLVQPKTSKHARREKSCHGAMCEFNSSSLLHSFSYLLHRRRRRKVKKAALNWSNHQKMQCQEIAFTLRVQSLKVCPPEF